MQVYREVELIVWSGDIKNWLQDHLVTMVNRAEGFGFDNEHQMVCMGASTSQKAKDVVYEIARRKIKNVNKVEIIEWALELSGGGDVEGYIRARATVEVIDDAV